MREFSAIAEQVHARAFYLDARNLELSPESFLAALQNVIAPDPIESALRFLSS